MKRLLTIAIPSIALGAAASACDACTAAMPGMGLNAKAGWYFGVAEQYTSYETLRLDGRTIPDSAGQYLHSSITQIYVGYDFENTFGIQVNVPLIYRTYRGVEGDEIHHGRISGIGDFSLLAHWTPLRIQNGDFSFSGRIVAGIKLPTGDTGALNEEGHDHESEDGGEHSDETSEHGGHDEHEEHEDAHDELPPGGVHGHDISLGTGSVDGVFGADFHLQWKRIFLDAGLQVIVRGDGDYSYDYADEVSWYAALGATVVEHENGSVAVAVRFAGESKGEDDFQGERAHGSSATNVYVGPQLSATWKQRLNASVGVGFPILRENSGATLAPDYRFEAAVGWQF